jgi:hypothetical protein
LLTVGLFQNIKLRIKVSISNFLSERSLMLKKLTRMVLLPAVAAVLVACGGGGGPSADVQGLQNPSAFRLSETVSAVPPQ